MRPLKNNPELSKQTLYKTRGQTAPLWYKPQDFGLERILDQKDLPLPIGLVQSVDGQYVGGRFFPYVSEKIFGSNYAILVYSHNDHMITVATIVHEIGHLKRYQCECKHVPRTKKDRSVCKYKGEHDQSFYDVLTPLYIQADIPLYAARIVDSSYNYPRQWDNGSYV